METLVDETTADLYITGACVGIDQAISTLIAARRPAARQRIIVPRDRSRVDKYWLSVMATYRNVEIVFMGRGSTYRDRNLALLGDRVLGFPEEFEPVVPELLIGLPVFVEDDPRSLRSGTWQTVRLAKDPRRNVPVRTVILSGLALTG